MGKLMLNNINYTGGSGGTNVVPNPPETATDDLISVKIDNTVYNLAGGGNVYGAFIDTNRVIQAFTPIQDTQEHTYTATEDCVVVYATANSASTDTFIKIDNVVVGGQFSTNVSAGNDFVYLRRGQTFSFQQTYAWSSVTGFTVYGLTFGTQNIFTPQIFSPEEREIGVWMDNKPLYCKTVYFDNIPKSSWTTLSLGLDTNDIVVNYDGVIITNNGVTWHLDNGGNNVFQSYLDANNGICLYWTYGASSAKAYVTVYYTKSSDVAGSGSYNTLGVPMVHIEDNVETVIGTYNGLPLYQKCYALINPTAGAFDTLSSIEDVIKISGTFKRTSTGIWYELDGRTESNNFNVYYVRVQIDASDNVILAYDGYSQSDIEKVRCTIQYTKTTD